MTFLKYLFIFCLFSFIGWILELVYRSLMEKRLVNPGFMTGCVVPLYGFGAVILNIICNLIIKIDSNYKVLLLFIVSTLILSLLEFISGFILYKFMHLKLWDYSMYKYNYKGFICLGFSFVWGFLSLIFYLFIYPWINNISMNIVSNNLGIFLLGIYTGMFIIDLCVSINLLNKLTKYANEIKGIVDLEKVKLDARMQVRRKKFLNAVYPYISTNKFLKDKIQKFK